MLRPPIRQDGEYKDAGKIEIICRQADKSCRFLLKYQEGSRDQIEVLKQGLGGVNEARKAVEEYTEKSPLYGLVQYRRRKIILKYVPDGTSRVLQGESSLS
jgi:hypothetical protein